MKLPHIAALIGTFATLAIAQGTPGGSVEGTVVNGASGSGIGGATVTLTGGPAARYRSTSDAAGHFKFTGVSPGDYRAGAEKDGFCLLYPMSGRFWRGDYTWLRLVIE